MKPINDNQVSGTSVQTSSLVLHVAENLVLDDVSFETSQKRVGIIGRNGSGKTSLARALCGIAKPTSGKVNIDGIDVVNDRKNAVSTVGLLFQNPDHQIIFPTVEEEITFGLTQAGVDRASASRKVCEFLRFFGMEDWAERSTNSLSHGQRQLVCLMAILIMQPKVIIFDEPFSGLDIPTALRLERYLSKLTQTLFMITHDPNIIAGYERVFWIEAGKIEMDGGPDEVLPAYRAKMEALGTLDA